MAADWRSCWAMADRDRVHVNSQGFAPLQHVHISVAARGFAQVDVHISVTARYIAPDWRLLREYAVIGDCLHIDLIRQNLQLTKQI